MHEKCGRDAERNQIRQRIEFAPERAFVSAHARDPAIEQIENAREQNEAERQLDLADNRRRQWSASTIFVSATKPQKRFPAVSRFGRK